MLISFSVTNFRSIEKKQTLSLLAQHSDSFPKHISTVQLPGNKQKKTCHLLKSVAIFGPNASGKSNFIEAMGHVKQFVIDSVKNQRGDEIAWADPFRLYSKTLEQPSAFEVVFVQKNHAGQKLKYEYSFAVTKQRVVEEQLIEYSSSRPTKLFSRKWAKSKYSWHFAENFKPRDIHLRTSENVLFLSKAAQENHDHLIPVFDWFRQTLQVLPSRRQDIALVREHLETQFEKKKSRLLRFLQDADVGIVDLQLVHRNIDDLPLSQGISEEAKLHLKDLLGKRVQAVHLMRDSKKKVIFDLETDESDGTHAMLALAAFLTEAAEQERVLFVDELDKSLHPLLVRGLFKAFHSLSKSSQVCFTLHSVQQMDEDYCRKDQVWLMEKDFKTKASSLYSLADFKGIRKEHSLDRRYLLGAYGALPIIGDFDWNAGS